MTAIPMLNYYARRFSVDGGDQPAGRKGRIFTAICNDATATRKKLATSMMIRPATVSDLVMELINDGLLLESRPQKSDQKGRPEIILSPAADRLSAIVCFTVSQTIHCALIDLDGTLRFRTSKEVSADKITKRRFLSVLRHLFSACHARIASDSLFCGFTLSLPGIVNEMNQTWVYSAYWPNLSHFDFSELANEFNCDTRIQKNLNCELRARVSRLNSFADFRRVLLIHWGLGVGSAMAEDARTEPHQSFFSEIGHCSIDSTSTAQCKCGLTGCVEAEAGLWALATQTSGSHVPLDEKQFEHYLNDHTALDFLERPITLMAQTLRNMMLTVTPDEIVITGPFAQNAAVFDSLTARLRHILPEESLVIHSHWPRIAPGRRSESDELIGAASVLFDARIGELCSDSS